MWKKSAINRIMKLADISEDTRDRLFQDQDFAKLPQADAREIKKADIPLPERPKQESLPEAPKQETPTQLKAGDHSARTTREAARRSPEEVADYGEAARPKRRTATHSLIRKPRRPSACLSRRDSPRQTSFAQPNPTTGSTSLSTLKLLPYRS